VVSIDGGDELSKLVGRKARSGCAPGVDPGWLCTQEDG